MRFFKFLALFLWDCLAWCGAKLGEERGSITMPNWWVHQFHDQARATYQQNKSLVESQLNNMSVRRGVKAAIDYHERFSNLVLSDTGVRHGQSVILNLDHSRRACTLVNSEGGILVSDIDTLRSMADPQNPSRDALIFAALRRADKHVLDAAIGSATTVTTGGNGQFTYGSQALPSSRKIGGATAFDLTRTINAAELLSKAAVPSGPQNRLMFFSPGQLRDILAITQASSSDFTKNQIHDKGTIDGVDWEGFHWVEVPDAIDIALAVLHRMLALSGTTRSCIAMARDAVGLSIGEEMKLEIDKRPDLRNEIQVYLKMLMAATRVFEGGVVQVDALEN